jgi:hypothetical protein
VLLLQAFVGGLIDVGAGAMLGLTLLPSGVVVGHQVVVAAHPHEQDGPRQPAYRRHCRVTVDSKLLIVEQDPPILHPLQSNRLHAYQSQAEERAHTKCL